MHVFATLSCISHWLTSSVPGEFLHKDSIKVSGNFSRSCCLPNILQKKHEFGNIRKAFITQMANECLRQVIRIGKSKISILYIGKFSMQLLSFVGVSSVVGSL